MLAALAGIGLCLSAAEKRVVTPATFKPVGPYSAGIMAGDFLYVSGQGARDAQGRITSGADRQARQCLANIRSIVEAAGLTMEHVVYGQLYLHDIRNYDEVHAVWTEVFANNPPARAALAVSRMPVDTPVEITAYAVRDLSLKKQVNVRGLAPQSGVSPAVRAGDRVYLSGVLGRDADSNRIPEKPVDQLKLAVRHARIILKAARLGLADLAYVNVYLSPSMPVAEIEAALNRELDRDTRRTIIRTAALPLRANVEISGVAAKDRKLGDTVYLPGRSGTTEEIMKGLEADLRGAGMTFANVVASNVYVDSIDRFAEMNKVYGTFFPADPPTRTTVQPMPAGDGQKNLISVIAVR